MDGRNRGLTLVEVLAIIVVIGLVLALFLPTSGHVHRNARVTACKNNLSQLWKMENIYMSMFGGPTKAMPTETGKAFWLKLREVKLVENDDLFNCPVRREPSPDCQYRGPGVGVVKLKADGIVGADDTQNHEGEGGNVLRKSGDVTELPEQHEFEALTAELQ